MEAAFLVCAVLGGTLMIGQFLMGLVGLGHHDMGFDHDLSDAGHGLGDHHDGSHGDSHHDAHHGQAQHGAAWFFKAVSFRTVVAAVTFFGLAGLAAVEADLAWPQPLVIAVISGLAAMYLVYFVMQSLYRLKADGTERITRAIGTEATVYLTIPAGKQGQGKIHFCLQNRLVEYPAMTAGDALATGTKVVIVDLAGTDTLIVEPISQTARTTHA